MRPRFALGTAQIGLPYGRANRSGLPDEASAVEIVRLAVASGVAVIDTARAYGASEERIGRALSGLAANSVSVVSKLSIDPADRESESATRGAVVESVRRSLQALHVASLDGMLLHDVSDYSLFGGCVVDELVRLRDQGMVGEIGISLNEPEEVETILHDERIQRVQVPFNLLSDEWVDVCERLFDMRALNIMTRSAYLQGVLISPPSVWPQITGYDPGDVVSVLTDLSSELHRDGVDDLCIAYLRGQSWIATIVVGVESESQLRRNLELFNLPPLTETEIDMVCDRVPAVPADVMRPWKWPRA